MKVAFLFPGQGAQYPNMLQDLYENEPACEAVFHAADTAVGRDISAICFEGTQEELNLTHNTQPCVLAADLAAGAALLSRGIKPDAVAGFSLGEYAALVMAGVMSRESAFRVVQFRADAMQEAVPVGEGAMAAILGINGDAVADLCSQVSEAYVAPANYNSPVQTVVSGTAAGVQQVCTLAEQAGTMTVPLQVSVPSHCALMQPAADKLKEILSETEFHNPEIPVYMNYHGEPLSAKEETADLLEKQLCNPVQWVKTIERMYESGIDVFIECGPGKTLSGLVKKTLKGKKIKILQVSNIDSLNNTLSALEE